ncbi:MAG: hypothetical protein ACQEW9_02285 [Bacteroidota bacterium]
MILWITTVSCFGQVGLGDVFDSTEEVAKYPLNLEIYRRHLIMKDFNAAIQFRQSVNQYLFSPLRFYPEWKNFDKIHSRIESLIGTGNFTFLMNTLQVQGPVKADGRFYDFGVCKPHDCGDTFMNFVYDASFDLLYAVFRNQNNFYLYAEQLPIGAEVYDLLGMNGIEFEKVNFH